MRTLFDKTKKHHFWSKPGCSILTAKMYRIHPSEPFKAIPNTV